MRVVARFWRVFDVGPFSEFIGERLRWEGLGFRDLMVVNLVVRYGGGELRKQVDMVVRLLQCN